MSFKNISPLNGSLLSLLVQAPIRGKVQFNKRGLNFKEKLKSSLTLMVQKKINKSNINSFKTKFGLSKQTLNPLPNGSFNKVQLLLCSGCHSAVHSKSSYRNLVQAATGLKVTLARKRAGQNEGRVTSSPGWPSRVGKFVQYNLETYHRSNQDTCLIQKPAKKEGDWVEIGDLLADSASSIGGELSIGHNIIVAYMPWEGYNYEDAILINERLVYEDIYTSIHIERYEIITKETKLGPEQITRDLPDINENLISHLDKNGIAKIGSWVQEGDILVGKITPFNVKTLTPQQKLLYKIFNKELSNTKDSSLRAPKGIKANVINVNILKREKSLLNTKKIKQTKKTKSSQSSSSSLEQNVISKSEPWQKPSITSKQSDRNKPSYVHIYLAEKRKMQVGDKMAGRHGNKGIVSRILPRQDMPFLPDGTAVDIVLNPLGVPSRMNVGQIYECLLGLAGYYLGEHYKIPPFDEIYGADASRSFVLAKLYEARKKTGLKWLFDPNNPGKMRLFDGRTSQSFDQTVTVGIAYVLKLVHMVDDKLHCLTPDHDVLTTSGWMPIHQVTTHHKVATLTQKGELIYQHPTAIHNYLDYEGELYQIRNKNIDLLVTPNHRMYVKNGKITGTTFTEYQLVQAKHIYKKHKKYLKNATNTSPDYQFVLPSVYSNSLQREIPAKQLDMEAWLIVFGLWIAEGWARTNVVTNHNTQESNIQMVYPVVICQDKPRVVAVLGPALRQLGYNYFVNQEKFYVNDKQLWSYLHPLSLGAPLKQLPEWVWELSQRQAQRLLHSMCLVDGTWRKNSMFYYTTSLRLADDVMRLALHAGWSSNKYLHQRTGNFGGISEGQRLTSNFDVWRLAIIEKNNSPAVNHGHHKTQSVQVEKILPLYKGAVHCISVPNEVFYVRRNGIPIWTGNSRSTGPYSLVTQQPLRGRSKQGGQRLGEMEVWAIEGYGAAFVLSEMLTIKSDDMTGRQNLWKNLIENNDISLGSPESFKVLVCELQALCLDIGLFRKKIKPAPNGSLNKVPIVTDKDMSEQSNKNNNIANRKISTKTLIEIDSLLHLA